MPVLSPCTDIKSLIEQHAGIQTVGKPSYVHGVLEYHSNCPFCGGTDRFITRPETGQYTCTTRASGCPAHGDMIDFLRDYAGMSRREACEEIGIDPDELEFMRSEPVQSALAKKNSAPGKVWRDRADEEAALAQARLRRSVGSVGLDALRARGFSDEIIQERNLGYLPLTNGRYLRKDPIEIWGLTYEEVQKEHVNVFEGVLIPWYVNKQIWKLEVRRITDVDPDHRTPEILGSREPLYNCDAIQAGKPVVLSEGALDAISGIQACGDDRAVFVATGGTGKARFDLWIKRLSEASCVLVAFDDDEPGRKGAKLWVDALPNAIRWVPRAHDINDMLRDRRDGESIREWLTDGLNAYELIKKTKHIPVKLAQPVVTSTVQSQAPDHIENVLSEQPFTPLQGKKQAGVLNLIIDYAHDFSSDEVIRIAITLTQMGLTFSEDGGMIAPIGRYSLHDYSHITREHIIRFVLRHESVLLDWMIQGAQGAVLERIHCGSASTPLQGSRTA